MDRQYVSRIAAFLTAFALLGGSVGIPAAEPFRTAITVSAADEYTIGTYDSFTYRAYADHIEITQCDYTASEIVIPAEIDGLPVTSVWGSSFFDPEVIGGSLNTTLRSLTIPETVSNISFHSCLNLTTVIIDGENSPLCVVDNVLFTKDMQTLMQYPAGLTAESYKIPDGVTSIQSCAFTQCENLTAVEIPETVTSIGNSAFDGCEKLQAITLPAGLTELGTSVFWGCNSLTTANIPEAITEVPDFLFMFCSNLTEVQLPEKTTSIGQCAFYTTGISNLTLPETLTTIGDNAFTDSALTRITIPAAVESIGNNAFSGCLSLQMFYVDPENQFYASQDGVLFDKEMTTLMQYPDACQCASVYTIPSSVQTIKHFAFEYNKFLQKISIPENVTSIEAYAFAHCEALTEVVLLAETDLIENYTFYYSELLDTITLTDAVTAVEHRAFTGCAAETTVYYTGTEEQWNAMSIAHQNEALTEATVYFEQMPSIYALGDVNGDGWVDARDASYILIEAAEVGSGADSTLSEAQRGSANVNARGEIDANDAALVLLYAAATGHEPVTFEDFIADYLT